MSSFFQTHYRRPVDPPNQQLWWHSLPLPDGNRINGVNPDKDLQFKIWEAFQIPHPGGLVGQTVLDIGAADGFFTVAALPAGARHATAVGTRDWVTWPDNIAYAT
jgi:tRNA (mo5U34)-methyltransferase